MKKKLLIVTFVFAALQLQAQDYDIYLKRAYTALDEGNIEVAQSTYNVYKRMTDKTDPDFEVLLKSSINNDWKSRCYIINLNDTIDIAVQFFDEQEPLPYITAKTKAESSRLGNFSDWRLPYGAEMRIILPNIKIKDKLPFWIDKKTRYSEGRSGPNGYNKVTYDIIDAISYKTSSFEITTYKDGHITKDGNIIKEEPRYNYLIVRIINKNYIGKKSIIVNSKN